MTAAKFEGPRLAVPVSLSAALVDERGLVAPSRIHPAGQLAYENQDCHKSSYDISDAVNSAVAKARGDAVVNLVVQARAAKGCIEVRLSGDIVKVDP